MKTIEVKENIIDIMIMKYLERGYSIKKEGNYHYRIWNNNVKLYLHYYENEWCISEVDTYTTKGKFIKRPVSAINFLNGRELDILNGAKITR